MAASTLPLPGGKGETLSTFEGPYSRDPFWSKCAAEVLVPFDVGYYGDRRGDVTVRDYSRVSRRRKPSNSSGTVNGNCGHSYLSYKEQRCTGGGVANSPGNHGLTLMDIIRSEASLELFVKYCKFQRCTEAIEFWLTVEAFQNKHWKAARVLGLLKDSATGASAAVKAEVIHSEALAIYERFLASTAETMVNMPSDVAKGIRDILFRSQHGDARPLAVSELLCVFRGAQRYIFRDMESFAFPEFLKRLSHRQIQFLMNEVKSENRAPGLATVHAIRMLATHIKPSADRAS